MAYDIANIIEWAKMSQPLAAVGEAKKAAFRKDNYDPDLHLNIYDTRRDVEYEYDQDPTGDNCYKMANFLYAICFPYVLEAQFRSGGSGGSVAPVVPSGSANEIYFIVSPSSYLPSGTSATTLTGFIGMGLVFSRGGIIQSTVQTEPSWFYWDRTTGDFTCSPALQTDELVGLIPV